ncbi:MULTISPECIES: 2-succinyl-5-enolpyruvyl-6-hydroxy-3-cyclohexene-1-carboxylic-acid synthase [unclassified Synechococcus]|uniref:2-succinyl-5-enolpyruvyl-6-hydroxy-3- cyclohexene-1-carboxylic-acid synthase n=1 Tax=unclassified Synechococcus TaxID=2626047 RepID=UPI001CF860D6|nr:MULTISPECIES: 2-succinyl-5-enolpyruvyl-6-hydroxy-3-cyclohexene-1-carboxylic-acid synthase [unclassified Synechococcus]MCB4378734.1 2-succinyl-5-enolpyruvyl-6-hydroxy-3-cyclohexene-1-carboxylic-acid synthase [Synechococcus sp. MU1650]
MQAALTLLEALCLQGLKQLVLCPGSRSGPLATAAGVLASQAKLQLVTAIDERSAAFLALGMATAGGRAVAVVTTSGTAVANLLPAAVEADRSCQPLLLLTADRPVRLKNCGANQTVNQESFLLAACRWFGSGAADGVHMQANEALNALAVQAWQQAQGAGSGPPGPVQLNLPFEEPLHTTLEQQQQLVSGACLSTACPEPSPEIAPPPRLDPERPGVVIAGAWRGLSPALAPYQQAVSRWLNVSGWPVLADPLAALAAECPNRIEHWELQLDELALPENAQVLRLGPMPASRRLEAWLQRHQGPQLLITEGDPRPLDPLRCASQWSGGMAAWMPQHPDPDATPKPSAGRNDLSPWIEAQLPLSGAVNEPALAYWLPQLLPGQLPVMLAASSPVRDWLTWSGPASSSHRCFSFRGASGIDGTLSLAMGLAVNLGPLALVTGDLALLHDSNGWLHASSAAAPPPLLVLLIDNGGGGIFQQLPIATPGFESLFAMPQQVDPLALAAAHGVPGRQVACLDDLQEALAWGLSLQRPVLLRLCTDRGRDAALRQQLRIAAQNEGSVH